MYALLVGTPLAGGIVVVDHSASKFVSASQYGHKVAAMAWSVRDPSARLPMT
jgi:hypothetical protein